MKIFKIFPAVLLICMLLSLSAPAALALEGPQLTAKAALLTDLDSGVVLYEKNGRDQRSPASLTKVMTILLTLEAVEKGEASLDDTVTAGADCRSGMRDDSSSVGIVSGESMRLRDLLYCAAVASGNDACNVIASYLGGGIPNFVNRMNTRAEALGCSQTHFVDPSGLSYDNLTCAYDLVRITRAAMEHPAFMELCDSVSYTVPATNLNRSRELNNSNALISTQGIYGASYLYEGAHGVKTGYTRAAGYCLISTAERDGMRLLAVVLGCDGPYLSDTDTRYNFVDTARLYDWAFANFSPRTVFSADQPLFYAEVILAWGDPAVDLLPLQTLRIPLPKDLAPGEEDLRISLYDEALTAPIETGAVLGRVQLYLDGRELASVPLTAGRDVPLDVPAALQDAFQRYFSRIWSES